MNDERGTLELVAENLALALEPLREAVQDVDSFQTFLYGLGWNVSDLPPSYAALGALVDDTLELLEELDTSPDPAKIVELLGKVKDVHTTVEGLTEVPTGAEAGTFLGEFAERLFEFLLARYLAIAQPSIFHALRLLGVIVLEAFPETATRPAFVRTQIDYEAIPDMVADPASIPKRVYGWGTDSLDFDLIAGELQDLLLAIGLPAALEQVEPDLAEGYQDPTKTEEVIGRRVKVIFLGTTIGDIPVELALAVLPYPAEDSKPAGLIVQPVVPEQLGLDYDLTDSLKFSLRAGTNVASLFGVIVRPGEITVRYPFQPGTTLPSAGFGAALDYAPATTRTLLGVPDGTRLQVAGARFGLDLDDRAGRIEFRLAAETHELALVLDAGDEDGFLQKVLGSGTHQFPIPLAIVWSSRTGFGFGDGGSFEFAFAPHLQLGPVRVETLKIRLRGGRENGNAALTTETVVGVSGALGPVAFSAEDIGAQLKLVFASGNAGPFDIAVGFRPPTGVGLEVDAAAITGGGFLFFDNEKKQYAGVLELSLENRIQLKVVGILNTILPGGQQGFSLLLIITAEFEPMQLGFGFTLNGVGGLAGINRTMLVDVLRAGLRNRTLDSILFPPDPVQNAPKIISDLSTIFPPLAGRYTFGPQLKIGWGTPTLISAAVGVFIELPPPIRLAILAQIKAALPDEETALIEINMDAIGTYEEEKQRLAVDATLYDSQVVGFPLTGDMAMRLTWGSQPFFALSVGGFNPRYSIPSGVEFPQLHRLELTMGSGAVRMNLDTYLAVTSNTAQFGAHLDLRVGGGMGLHGWLGFDALFVFSPFSFVVDMSAGVDLIVGGEAVMTIHLNFTLSGPTPWHAWGEASISLFFFSISVPFDVRWGSDAAVELPPVDAQAPLLAALRDSRNWTAASPAERELAATLRGVTPPKIAGTEDQVIVGHPFARLTVREKVVPLDVRIDKFGNAAPAKWSQFRITFGRLNLTVVQPETVQDYFARGQFTELSNDEKLSRPSFELMDAGVTLGPSDVATGYSSPLEVHYETFIVDDLSLPARRGPLYRLDEDRFFAQLGAGAAGRSKAWTTGARKYLEPDAESSVSVRDPGYVIAGSDDLALRTDVLARATSRLEAEQLLEDHLDETPGDRGKLQVVPEYEAAA